MKICYYCGKEIEEGTGIVNQGREFCSLYDNQCLRSFLRIQRSPYDMTDWMMR